MIGEAETRIVSIMRAAVLVLGCGQYTSIRCGNYCTEEGEVCTGYREESGFCPLTVLSFLVGFPGWTNQIALKRKVIGWNDTSEGQHVTTYVPSSFREDPRIIYVRTQYVILLGNPCHKYSEVKLEPPFCAGRLLRDR